MFQNPVAKKIAILIFAVIFFFVFSSLWGVYRTVRPPKFVSEVTPGDFNLNYEEVKFQTQDGLTLAGWFVPSQGDLAKLGDAPTIILLHGYPADKGDILFVTSFLGRDYNLFLFDFRYFGESEGKYSTIGVKEVRDLKAAVEYLKSRGINEIGAWGFSMGGAVALMASPNTPEIKAIVSESSYARLDLLAQDIYLIPLVNKILGKISVFWGDMILGTNIKEESPLEAAKKITIPVLLIHSTDDQVIPFSHAEMLKDALGGNQQAEFWFKKGFLHGEFSPQYEARVLDFFAKNLK